MVSSSLALSQLGPPMILQLELLLGPASGHLSLLLLLHLRRNPAVLDTPTSAVPG